MEENKFERQVQQKMDELQLQPSDAVWKKIELQIAKKKSRRWGLIILFLCTGILLSGAYWLWNAKQHTILEKNNSVQSKSEKNSNPLSIKQERIVQQQINPAPEPGNKKSNIIIKDEVNSNLKKNTLSNSSKITNQITFDENSSSTFSYKKKIKSEIRGKMEIEIIPVETLQNETATENTIEDSLHTVDKNTDHDTLSRPVVTNKIIKEKDTSKQQETIAETAKYPRKNKWRFEVLFVGGVSGIGKDPFLLNYPATSFNPGTLNSGGQQQPSSRTIVGLGFIAGISAEKDVSQKIKFISGINFKSFGTSFKLYDSAGTYYARYAQGAANKYINHFNFIEVPLSLRFQVGNGKHLPLSWQAGIAISQLICSNALQLNSSTGYYYKDNSILNKTQIGFNTSFLLTLFSKQKNSVLIGPYLNYNVSKIASAGLYNKKHFVFTGLQVTIIFGK